MTKPTDWQDIDWHKQIVSEYIYIRDDGIERTGTEIWCSGWFAQISSDDAGNLRVDLDASLWRGGVPSPVRFVMNEAEIHKGHYDADMD